MQNRFKMKIAIRHILFVAVLAVCIGCVKRSTHEEVLEKLKVEESENSQLKSNLASTREEYSKTKSEADSLKSKFQNAIIVNDELSKKITNQSFELKNTLLKNEALAKELAETRKHLDEYENGYDRNVAIIKSALQSTNFGLANERLVLINRYHPQKLEDQNIKTLIADLKQKEQLEKSIKENEEKEKIRQANINNTGKWVIGEFTDSFGDKTGKKYVTIVADGTFTRSGSPEKLSVQLVTFGENITYFKFMRSYGNLTLREKPHYWEMRDSDGQQYKFMTEYVRESSSHVVVDGKAVHSALLKGGKIQFRGRQSGEDHVIAFDFNSDFFDNAFRMHRGNSSQEK